MKTKGALEILRHHRTERHLRGDQRRPYQHLNSVDPVSGKVQHRFRVRKGKNLTKIELAKEHPKFILVELVDVGERFPFYENFIEGTTTAIVTFESRTRTQFAWSEILSIPTEELVVTSGLLHTNHQANFCDFDWGKEHLAVGIVF